MESIKLEEAAKDFKPGKDMEMPYGWKPVYQWGNHNVFLAYRDVVPRGRYHRILAGLYMDNVLIPNGASSDALSQFILEVRGNGNNIPSIIGINELGMHQSVTEYVYDPETNTGYSLCDGMFLYRFADSECTRIYSTEGKRYAAAMDLFYEELNITAGFEPGIDTSLLVEGDIPFSKR